MMKSIHKKIFALSLLTFFLLFVLMVPFLKPFLLLLPLLLLSQSLKNAFTFFWDRFVFSISIFACLNIVVATIFWILGIRFNFEAIYFIHAGMSLLLGTYVVFSLGVPRLPLTKRLEVSQLYPLLLAGGVFMMLMVPIGLKINTNYIYQFVLFGGDNITHLELINGVKQNEGFLYKDVGKTKDIITKNNSAYPEGLHLNLYIFQEYANSVIKVDSPKKQVLLYVFITSLFYAVFAYIWTRIAFILLRSNKGKYKRFFEVYTFLLFTLVFYGSFLHFYLNGFQPHIFSLLLFGNILYLSIHLFNRKKDNALFFAIIFFLNIGIAFTWLLLAPISLLISVILFLTYFFKDLIKTSFLVFIQTYKLLLLVIFLSTIFCMVQIYVQISFGIKNNPINEPGLIVHPEQSLVILSAVTPFLFYIFSSRGSIMRKKENAKAFPIVIFALVSAVFSLLIYLYQMYTIGHPEYYYFKSAYHLILLGAVSLPVILQYLVEDVIEQRKHLLFFGVISSALAFAVFVGVPQYATPIIQGTVSNISPGLTNAYGNIINQQPQKTNNIIAVGSCNRQQDYLITRLSGVLGNDNVYTRQIIAFDILNNTSDRDKWIKAYQAKLGKSNEKLIILDSHTASSKILSSDILHKADVRSVVEAGPSHGPSACPSRFTGTVGPQLYDIHDAF